MRSSYRHMLVRLAVTALIAASGCSGGSSSPTAPPHVATIREFAIAMTPFDITRGPDGNLWVVGSASSGPATTVIGRVTTSGTITLFNAAGSSGESITTAPDGNLWFTEQGGRAGLGKVTPAGVVTEYTAVPPAPVRNLAEITFGSDGNLWATSGDRGAIDAYALSGQFQTSYQLVGRTAGIATGADGALWVAEDTRFTTDTPRIARVTTVGAVTQFTLPARPFRLTAGKDGNIWFGEPFGSNIGRLTPAGAVTEFPVAAGANVYGITTAADGTFWFTELAGNAVGHIAADGTLIATYPLPNPASGPIAICIGPDGNIWFAEQSGRIGELIL